MADWVGSTRYPIHVTLAVIEELAERDLYFKRVELESRVKEHTSGRILKPLEPIWKPASQHCGGL
ncbi:MAG: hypothetical protein QXU65_05610 [Sulfolobales archaeon]